MYIYISNNLCVLLQNLQTGKSRDSFMKATTAQGSLHGASNGSSQLKNWAEKDFFTNSIFSFCG